MPLDFLTRDETGVDPDGREDGEQLGGAGGGKTIIRIYCKENISFQQKDIFRR